MSEGFLRWLCRPYRWLGDRRISSYTRPSCCPFEAFRLLYFRKGYVDGDPNGPLRGMGPSQALTSWPAPQATRVRGRNPSLGRCTTCSRIPSLAYILRDITTICRLPTAFGATRQKIPSSSKVRKRTHRFQLQPKTSKTRVCHTLRNKSGQNVRDSQRTPYPLRYRSELWF